MPTAHTRTGQFPIGFRKLSSPWQKDPDALITWARDNNFAFMDLPADLTLLRRLHEAHFPIGSLDLLHWRQMLSDDPAKRRDALQQNLDHIRTAAALGVRRFFCVMLPENPAADRKETFRRAVETYAPLIDALEKLQARLVIEGWPGPGAICCTPETLRAFFREVPSPANAINFDPSHLVRMGIDHIRFLQEFADRIGHVHAKDTEIFSERLYDLGFEQPPTFAEPIPFAGSIWRYTIPGHGTVRWPTLLEILRQSGYQGGLSVELEDAHFNGSEETEKLGLVLSRRFLEGC